MDDEVGQSCAVGVDAGVGKVHGEAGACEGLARGECFDDDIGGLVEFAVTEIDRLVVSSHEPVHTATGESHDPAEVSGNDEMPRRPQDVGAQEGAVVERLVEHGVGETRAAPGDRPFAPGRIRNCATVSGEPEDDDLA